MANQAIDAQLVTALQLLDHGCDGAFSNLVVFSGEVVQIDVVGDHRRVLLAFALGAKEFDLIGVEGGRSPSRGRSGEELQAIASDLLASGEDFVSAASSAYVGT